MHEDDLYGPPTVEDDLWFLEHVVAAGYPKVKRDPEPMPGQMSISDYAYEKGLPPVCSACEGRGWLIESTHAEACYGNCERHGCPVQVRVQCWQCESGSRG